MYYHLLQQEEEEDEDDNIGRVHGKRKVKKMTLADSSEEEEDGKKTELSYLLK